MRLIDHTSRRITNWLITSGAISAEEQELFFFSVYSFFFSMIPLLLSLSLGFMIDMKLESVLMISPFVVIRKFSGGFHLKSARWCFFTTILLLVCALLMIKHLFSLGTLRYLHGSVLASSLIVYICSPIDSKERALSDIETKRFKKIARSLIAFFCCLYYSLSLCSSIQYAVSIGVGITIVALLQIPCIFLPLRKLCQKT